MLFLKLLHIGIWMANEGWIPTWMSGCISGYSSDDLETNMKSSEDEKCSRLFSDFVMYVL